MIFPYDITAYNIDVICGHISHKTGTPFHLVKQKKQISYLDCYLQSPDIAANTLIIENSYIEKNYTENYSEYYSRCFHPYSKTCSRIHFFNLPNEWSSEKLEQLLNDRDGGLLSSEGYSELCDGYIGFVVIRPIPNTFLDKICLKIYERLSRPKKNAVIKRKYDVSLFGMPLSIETVAFQEQDKVLSACATSALWSFTHATNHRMEKDIPSPGTITKLAKPSNQGHDRQFPNSGLSSYMIRRFINEAGLEPEQVSLKESMNYNSDLLKEYSYSFISSKIPLICGISVYEESTDADGRVVYQYKGDHAISILGYSLNEELDEVSDINLTAHSIDKIYAHDDRIGPFTRFIFKDSQPVTTSDGQDIKKYLVTEIDNSASSEILNFKKEVIVPNILILGVYHKIRINYSAIKSTAVAFNRMLNEFFQANNYDSIFNEIGFITDTSTWNWDISLYEVNDFKKEIIQSGLKNKAKYLTAHWPKYIWSIEVEDEDKKPLFSLCFDATDIPQGKIFLDVLIFNQKTATMFQAFSEHCEDMVSKSIIGMQSNIDTNFYLWGIINYMADVEPASYSNILDEQYGEVRIPRYFKDDEIRHDSLYFTDSRFSLYEETQIKLDESVQYLWLINEEGWLIIGEEKLIKGTGSKIGHVTLNKGRPGRIAGELKYQDECWIINGKSGRYSGNYSSENLTKYVSNAVEKRFKVYLKGHCLQAHQEIGEAG